MFTNHNSIQYVLTQKTLNLQQKRLLELLNDYDTSILYHPGKANVVANALIQMSMDSVAYVPDGKKELVQYVHILAWLGV